MTTQLITTITYANGTSEREIHDWHGWNRDDAASCMRARRHVPHDDTGPRDSYDIPLRDIDHAAGITRIHHQWTETTSQPIPA